MKRPKKKYFEIVGKNYQNVYDNERYEEHLNAFIDHLENQNKELIEENTNLRNTLSCIVSGE